MGRIPENISEHLEHLGVETGAFCANIERLTSQYKTIGKFIQAQERLVSHFKQNH